MHPEHWLTPTPHGLYCQPGNFYIDPMRPVERALVTHGHADHARPGHAAILATQPTLDIMHTRYKNQMDESATQAVAYGESLDVNGVAVSYHPAGHILGSSQISMTYKGQRVVISGDYKRRPDPTCPAFEPVPCDVFITEATFGLPVFKHPDDRQEVQKLLDSMGRFPARPHLIGAYALGKCQRLICLLRKAGYDKPIYLHGAQFPLCDLYRNRYDIDLGELRPATLDNKADFAGALIIAPPSATIDKWARRFGDPVIGMASGWMLIRQRAKQKGVELPIIISDHADWPELTQTLEDVQAPEIWVTHGREDALIYHAQAKGLTARALSLIGYDAEDES